MDKGSLKGKEKSKAWMAVYTMPRSEKKVAERLVLRGLDSYCPTQITLRQWSDRKKKVEVPVFPSYVFVFVDEVERIRVLETPGVRNFVFWLGKPAVIRDEEVEAIKEFLDEHDHVEVSSQPMQVGEAVEIMQGQFAGLKGKVTRESKKRVQLQIESIGIALVADIEKSKIRKVS